MAENTDAQVSSLPLEHQKKADCPKARLKSLTDVLLEHWERPRRLAEQRAQTAEKDAENLFTALRDTMGRMKKAEQDLKMEKTVRECADACARNSEREVEELEGRLTAVEARAERAERALAVETMKAAAAEDRVRHETERATAAEVKAAEFGDKYGSEVVNRTDSEKLAQTLQRDAMASACTSTTTIMKMREKETELKEKKEDSRVAELSRRLLAAKAGMSSSEIQTMLRDIRTVLKQYICRSNLSFLHEMIDGSAEGFEVYRRFLPTRSELLATDDDLKSSEQESKHFCKTKTFGVRHAFSQVAPDLKLDDTTAPSVHSTKSGRASAAASRQAKYTSTDGILGELDRRVDIALAELLV